MTLSDQLRHYNKWRRGDETIEQPNPTELGELLDTVADRLEVLELELQKYGTHGWDCKQNGECTCGLTEAIGDVCQ